MFDNKCLRCGSKVSSSSNFCSNCGADLSKNYDPRDYGMLGKDDYGSLNEFPLGISSIIGNLTKEMMKQVNSMTKEIQQPQEKVRPIKKANNPNIKQSGISISISSSGNGQPKIEVRKFGDGKKINNIHEGEIMIGEDDEEYEEIEEIIPNNKISVEKAKKYSKLPKEEAKSRVRRIGDKVVYEIDIPGVKRLDDVIINRIESGIEIKAFTNDKSYFKNLPVNYPITDYKLAKGGKLLIEMEEVE